MGEYAALVAAGVLSFVDALRLVARRGELMAAQGGAGGMSAVIGLDRETVQRAIEVVATPADLVVANDNAPGQVVLSGTHQALAAAQVHGAVIQGRKLNAIQLTTAAGITAVLELFAKKKLGPGFVKQESVALEDFLGTQWGGRVYGE